MVGCGLVVTMVLWLRRQFGGCGGDYWVVIFWVVVDFFFFSRWWWCFRSGIFLRLGFSIWCWWAMVFFFKLYFGLWRMWCLCGGGYWLVATVWWL